MKILYCMNAELLEQGKPVKCLVEGSNSLVLLKKDGDVIRKCISINNKNAFTGVKPYETTSDMLNLTEKETKAVMDSGKLTVYRSSGAVNDKGETLTREEQIKLGVARQITIVAKLIDTKSPGVPSAYKYDIISDTGASYRLEGEYTF